MGDRGTRSKFHGVVAWLLLGTFWLQLVSPLARADEPPESGALTPPAAGMEYFDMKVPAEDKKAADQMIARSGTSAAMILSNLSQVVKYAHGRLAESISATSPDLDSIVREACTSAGDNRTPGDAFLARNECRLKAYKGIRDDASAIVGDDTTAENFAQRLAAERAKHPLPWYVFIFDRSCAGGKDAYACFRTKTRQISYDSKAAADAFSTFYHQLGQRDDPVCRLLQDAGNLQGRLR